MLADFSEALHRHGDFLSRHPGCVVQTLWNHCAWTSPEVLARLTEQLERVRSRHAGECWIRALEPPLGHDPRIMWVLRGHIGTDIALAFSSDAMRLATGCLDSSPRAPGTFRDTTARIWNLATGRPTCTISPKRFFDNDTAIGIRTVAFSADDRLLILTEAGGSELSLWDSATGECVEDHVASGVEHTQISSDHRWLAVIERGASKRNDFDYLVLQELRSDSDSEELKQFTTKYRPGSPSYSVDWRYQSIGQWVRIVNGTLDLSVDGTTISVPILEHGRSPDWLYFPNVDDRGGWDDGAVRILNRTIPARLTTRFRPLMRFVGGVQSFLDRGPRASLPLLKTSEQLVVGYSGTSIVVTFPSGAVETFVGHEAAVGNHCLSKDLTRMATADESGTVIVWRLAPHDGTPNTGALRTAQRRLETAHEVSGARFRFAVAGERTLQVFDAGGSTPLCEVKRPLFFGRSNDPIPSGTIIAIALSPDESQLAFSQYGRGVAVWNLIADPPSKNTDRYLKDGQLMSRPDGSELLPDLLSFSSDSKRLFGATRLPYASYEWDPESGVCLQYTDEFIDPDFRTQHAEGADAYLSLSRTEIVARTVRTNEALTWLPFATDVRFDADARAWIVGHGARARRFEIARF